MPKKKESVWIIGSPPGELPPFMWQVWLKGKKNPIEMSGFDKEHIISMCEPKKVIKVKRIKAKKKPIERGEPLGPNGGNGVTRPADYDKGFKILRKWVDENGGPPENVRKQLREFYIDYEKVTKKK
jgi:hypothetical protein